MKIQYCSDLHLEFFQNKRYLELTPLQPSGEVLIIAGDTCHFSDYAFKLPFFDLVSEQFELVLLIPGNHEFYGGKDISITDEPFIHKIRHNVWLCNNEIVDYKDLRFILTTLWSMISMRNSLQIKHYMSDFRFIKVNNKILDIADYNLLHQRSLQFLDRALNEAHKNKIVVTHHLPSPLCNAEEFKHSINNEAFCVDLTQRILDTDAHYWIYGHSHRNMPEINLNETKLVTNQFGYVSLDEHLTFRHDAHFEI